VPRAGQVDLDQPGPFVVAVAVQRLGRPEAGVVDQDGQPPEPLGRLADGGIDRGRVGHIRLPTFVRRVRVEVQVEDPDPGTVGREAVGHRPADAPGAAGDDRAPPRQRARHQNP
jgi:hypothetical protein